MLVGGRLSQGDLKSTGDPTPLKTLQSKFASQNIVAVQNALKREVAEETGLQADDYTFEEWRSLKPYTALEGAGANHALTEYRIKIFHLDLTESGYLKLLSRVAADDALVWFSHEEFISAKSVDGKSAFIDALLDDFENQESWRDAVQKIQPAFKYSNNYSGAPITLPASVDENLYVGKTGKEKAISLETNADDILLLNGLALVLKGERRYELQDRVQSLGDGWLSVESAELCGRLRKLAQELASKRLPIIDIKNQQLFRLSCDPDDIFFSESLFEYELLDGALSLRRKAVQTPLAVFAQQTSNPIELSVNLEAELGRLSRGEEIKRYSPEDLKKILRREIRPVCMQMGLRSLVRVKNGEFRICIGMS